LSSPPDKTIVLGVIDLADDASVETPEVVADRRSRCRRFPRSCGR